MKNYVTLLDTFMDDFFPLERMDDATLMNTDIVENDDNYEMYIDVPSVKKENLKVSVDNGYLTVKANFNDNRKEKKGSFYVKERRSGEFSRTYYVGNNVKMKDVEAKLDSGVLTIKIAKPQKEEEETKFIEIN